VAEGFSADWLALRAAADGAARATALEARLRTHLAASAPPHRIVDLGAGTGNNARHLSPRLPGPQHWTLVEGDPNLAEEAGRPGAIAGPDSVTVLKADLLAFDRWADVLAGADLVTCSALLDLVSSDWLACLVDRVRYAGTAFLAVLSYDGRLRFHPSDNLDPTVRDLFNRHQTGDKGFGPALGPRATETASALFHAAGYRVLTAASDWTLDSSNQAEADLMAPLLDGIAAAASDIAPDRRDALAAWHSARRHSGAVRVGHLDMLALPPEDRAAARAAG